jgi:two-component system NtrC family sensor kinase
MKIKTKLTLAFLLASLVPLVVLGVLSYLNAREAVTNGVLNQLQSVAVIQKHRIESIISQNLERLALVSSRTQLRISLDSYIKQGNITEQERMNTALRDSLASITDFEAIHLLDLNGEVVASTSETMIGSSLANEEAFTRGRAEEHSGALLFLDETEKLKAYLSGPLYLEDELIGVVIIRSNADNIISVVGDYTGLGGTGEAVLARRNGDGDALFLTPLRFDSQAQLRRTISSNELSSPVTQALSGNEGVFVDAVDYRGEPVLAATQYIEAMDWGLVTKIDQTEAFAPVTRLHNLAVFTIVFAAAVVVAVSLYLARNISKPIQSLTHVADKIREGNVSQRAQVTSNDEIGMLAQHFNEMTEDLVRTNNTLRSTNRALKTISECNQILVRSTEESTLLKGICRIIVTHGGYRGARVGLLSPSGEVIVYPAAEAWHENGNYSNHDAVWTEDEDYHAIFMEAANTGEPQVLKSIHSDAQHAYLRAEADERGYTSLIALPLSTDGQTSGVLFIYGAEASPFREDEVKLLTELADDLAYGINAQRMRVKREGTEEQLQKSEEKYATLVERGNDGIIIIQGGMLKFANTRMVDMSGFSLEEVIGRPFIDFVAPDYRELVADRYQKRMSGETVTGNYEIAILTRYDRNVPVEINASLIEYEGKPADMAIVRDITERKQAEETLRESEERYRALVDLGAEVGEAVIMLQDSEHGDAVHIFFNREWPRITGYSREELPKMSFFDLVHPEDRKASQERHQRKLRGEAVPGLFEMQIIRKDGTQFPVEVTSAYTKYLGGPANVVYIRDITERKQAEEALRHSELEKATILESMSELMVYQDTQHKILWANQAAVASAGLAPEELAGRHCYEIWPHLSEPCAGCPVVRARKSGQPEKAEIATPDGRVWFIRGYPIRDENDSIVGVVEVTSEITERKQAEEALRDSEERYRSLVDNVRLCILRSTLGPPGRILAVNPALEEITGYSRDELLAMDVEELYARLEDRKALMEELASAKGAVTRELRWRKKDGSEIVVLDRLIAVRGDGGDILYLDAIIEDITELKRAENALKASEEKLRLMFKSVPEGITVSDLDGNILETNEAVVHIHGYDSKEELIGKSALELIAKEDHDRAMESLKKTLEGRQSPTIEYTFLRKDGSEFPAELSAALLKDGTGNPIGFIAVTRDITERKMMEQQLILTDRLASIGELASGIAHELNNPLTGVIGLSQLLTQRDVPEDIKEDLNLVYSEAQRAATIVKNLLTFARKHPPAKELLNINDVIGKVLELRAYEERVSNIEVVTHLVPDLPQIMADYFQLQQVFLNIVINAEHFMIEAHNKGTLTVTTERAGDGVRASFTDDGPGIPKVNLGHIFDPFFTTKEVGKGTGLGLSICHGIVSAHNGQIYTESEPGKGATFVVELPLSQGEIE